MIDDIELARALHVLFVAHWIGGVAFVTLVALPLARSKREAQAGWALFEFDREPFRRPGAMVDSAGRADGSVDDLAARALEPVRRPRASGGWMRWSSSGRCSCWSSSSSSRSRRGGSQPRRRAIPAACCAASSASISFCSPPAAVTILGAVAGTHGGLYPMTAASPSRAPGLRGRFPRLARRARCSAAASALSSSAAGVWALVGMALWPAIFTGRDRRCRPNSRRSTGMPMK